MLLLSPAVNYLTPLLNFIIQKYFIDSHATCILWHRDFLFELQTPADSNFISYINIWADNLSQSLQRDLYNFTELAEIQRGNGLELDAMQQKLTIAIRESHCETFIAFQEHIQLFTHSFHYASRLSIWRSLRNRFLFVYRKDLQEDNATAAYFDDNLFLDQPNILIVEAECGNCSVFTLKTNKFIGPLAEHPEQFYILDRFDALSGKFELGVDLYMNKINNLQGREVTAGVFDYRPFSVVDLERQPQVKDHNPGNTRGTAHLDGTEVRMLLALCEVINCTVEVDSRIDGEWGVSYANLSGDGLFGLITERKSEYAVGAIYFWPDEYHLLDMSTFTGRSGVTCLVPLPQRITSWFLPFRPFQLTLWLGVFCSLILEAIALFGTRHLAPSDDEPQYGLLESFQFGYITTLKLFVSQGSDYVVNSNAVRTVLFACYMMDTIVTSVYGGGLASILTLPTLEEAADSVERLSKHGIPWAASSLDWIIAIKSVEDDPLVENLLSNYHIYTHEQLAEMAKSEDMGFVMERLAFGHFGNIHFLNDESLKRLKLMVDDIYYQYCFVYVPRLWGMLAKLNEVILNVHSTGLDIFWEWEVAAHYMDGQQQEEVQASMYMNFDVGPVQLDMNNFVGLILPLVVGLIFSVLAFIGELIYYKYYQKK
ncbi:glutamate [NMDA] receptor subunit 1 [Eurosta solidaginis]|uniref:glutamate [NMDA] receptor subunit 1 n=1 Tax=Eurosta solidaginis TaxID=178769 RepID=UPI003530D775